MRQAVGLETEPEVRSIARRRTRKRTRKRMTKRKTEFARAATILVD
jgi:hypothetical protein